MKVAVTILLMTIALPGKSQSVESWRKELQKQIFEQAKDESALHIQYPLEIIAMPVCYYPCGGVDILKNNSSCKPVVDSFAAYAVIVKNKKIKGIAENTGTDKFGFYSMDELAQLDREESERITYKMIRRAWSISPECFFLDFFPWERNSYEIMGVVLDGKTTYIDRELKAYENIVKLVEHRYGRDSFIQKADMQMLRESLKKDMTIEQARRLVDRDYVQYTYQHPGDTSGIIERFIEEFRRYVELNATQEKQVSIAIIEGLPSAPLYSDKTNGVRIPLFNKNIFPLVSRFGTASQFIRYKEFRAGKNSLLKAAYNMINQEDNK